MRWFYFLLIVLIGTMVQTTLAQFLWVRTPVGWVGPEILAVVAVYFAFNARSGVDAALAGWILGFALDLTTSGEGMGLLSLLYAALSAGLFVVRRAFFRERMLSQMLTTLAFCLAAYQVWTLYVLVMAGLPLSSWPGRALQAAGLAGYTALVAPALFAALKRAGRAVIISPSDFGGR